ncbi:DJ-1 family glyoxalase III [uncultured Clostridium sp.]|jgi:4-methyl-5(b-hydroxyethyl)-thiazole monophosphate biosynthesis|uniref:DJ-1 family glyoxalase III n=1 Tax=uncultured Clostridium sp. TaxID=59620 RepID=UPI002638D49D|nr:DJ-1 family glyoxalase III [uncultured Clostridium sp.]
MKKVLIMLAQGFETLEALSVKDICVRANVQCDLCGVTEKIVTSSHGIKVEADVYFEDGAFDDYDAIVIPGGMPGAKNLKENIRVIELIKDYYATGKIVASICAGPIALAKAGILSGRNVTSYPGYEEELGNVIYKEEVVVVDENIITSRGPATALEFSYEILKGLGYEAKAEQIKEAMLVNFYLSK